jgi:hypothetical protein
MVARRESTASYNAVHAGGTQCGFHCVGGNR